MRSMPSTTSRASASRCYLRQEARWTKYGLLTSPLSYVIVRAVSSDLIVESPYPGKTDPQPHTDERHNYQLPSRLPFSNGDNATRRCGLAAINLGCLLGFQVARSNGGETEEM